MGVKEGSHRVKSIAENPPVRGSNLVYSPVFRKVIFVESKNDSTISPRFVVLRDPHITLCALKSPSIIEGLGICFSRFCISSWVTFESGGI